MAGLNWEILSLSAWDIIKNGADVVIKVRDSFAKQTIRALYYTNDTDERIIAGESGVGELAGFIKLMTTGTMKNVREYLAISLKSAILFYNTEGVTDLDSFRKTKKCKPWIDKELPLASGVAQARHSIVAISCKSILCFIGNGSYWALNLYF